MSNFELESPLPSCTVTKDMIIQLENYLTEEIPNILNIPRETILNSYEISINDKIGMEKFKSINEFPFSKFDNNTSEIELSMSNLNFYLRIRFAKDRMFSKYKIDLNHDNARESTISISKGIDRIINAQKNNNYLFHPSSVLNLILLLLSGNGFMLFLINLFIPDEKSQLSELLSSPIFLIILVIFIYYSSISKLLHPFITFDSNKHTSLVKCRDWFYKGTVGFVIFGTILVLFRKQIIGF